MSSVVVLFGAGASAPAGIPIASRMSELLTDRPAFDRYPESLASPSDWEWNAYLRTIDFIRTQLAAWDPGPHRSFGPIDAELIFNQLLVLEDISTGSRDPFSGPLSEATASFLAQTTPGMLSTVRRRLLLVVREMVDPPVLADCSYLNPLTEMFEQQGHLTIATLNYDRTVETMAEKEGTPLDTGFEVWAKTGDFRLADDAIHLLKLHGSCDWFRTTGGASRYQGDVEVWHAGPNPYAGVALDVDITAPALLFGGSNKLDAHGPYLRMLTAFDDALSNASRLVVVGYSIRDPHINALIERFSRNDLITRRQPELVIVDPALDAVQVRLSEIHPHFWPAYGLKAGAREGLHAALFDPVDTFTALHG